MRTRPPHTTLHPAYRKVLKGWRPVILYFYSEHCGACTYASPVFREIAEPYRLRANIYMLEAEKSPNISHVDGFPTVLFFQDGKLRKKLKGIGDERSLHEHFAEHIGKVKAPATCRKPRHTLSWLHHTLSTLCTIPRAKRWNFS
ncbi:MULTISPECIES: co-chaperone YbbN [Pseudomonas]|uniref:thioredoxin family protein n=1 Tax=Pseudomonas TaxID=286 RepID=UPI000C880BA3|nr:MULTISPECIES: thioredoxin family protein [Pseudomonas]MCH4902051.1 thioredoxin [Pseudomonas sp. B707]PNA07454.1 thioredoxin [Pseudomonas sp. FW305-BF15]PNB48405.1 thioredoxin [Pseudomonas sp. GW456-12-10-14-LB2]PNB78382.1 thioredoxin [Pseudomonas sp. FW305-BF6]